MNILLIEDGRLPALSARNQLQEHGLVESLRTAPNSHEASAQLRSAKGPTLVIMDLQQCPTDPLSALSHLALSEISASTAFLGSGIDLGLLAQGVNLGLAGYFPRQSEKSGWSQALLAFSRSGEYFPAQERRSLQLRNNPDRAPAELSPGQRQVLALMRRGFSNQYIAKHLQLPEHAIRAYGQRIFAALQLSDQPDCVVVAQELGLSA